MSIKDDFPPHQLRVDRRKRPACYGWCCDNLVPGTWKMQIPIIGYSELYTFENEEDLMAFKLVWG